MNPRFLINPHQRNVMKLRVTGFEDLPAFVIRLRPESTPYGVGPAIVRQVCLGISINLMSFPISFDVVCLLAFQEAARDSIRSGKRPASTLSSALLLCFYNAKIIHPVRFRNTSRHFLLKKIRLHKKQRRIPPAVVSSVCLAGSVLFLHFVDDSLECCGVVHRELGEDLTVDLDTCFVDEAHEH